MGMNAKIIAETSAGATRDLVCTTDGELVVNAILVDENGVPIGSLGGALNVHDSDVHTRPLNLPVLRCTANTTVPAAQIVAGDTSFDVSAGDGVNFPVGTTISLTDGTSKETVLFKVTIQATDTLTLDMPVGLTYSTSTVVKECIANISSVAGTLTSPQIYEVGPPAGEEWHIVRFIVAMTLTSAGADNLFGNITALTNGIVFRISNGNIINFTNWKANSDMAADFYNLDYIPAKGGASDAMRGRASIKIGSGAIAKLVGDAGATIQILVQDDITNITSFSIKFQGHIEGQ